jgi:hypothetical protein
VTLEYSSVTDLISAPEVPFLHEAGSPVDKLPGQHRIQKVRFGVL